MSLAEYSQRPSSGTVIMATLAHVPDIARINNQLHTPSGNTSALPSWVEKEIRHGHVYVAETPTGETAGSITLEIQRDQIKIKSLAIEPIYQRSGYGRSLVDQTIRIAISLNKPRVFVGSHETFEPAWAFYEHLGFKRISKSIAGDMLFELKVQ